MKCLGGKIAPRHRQEARRGSSRGSGQKRPLREFGISSKRYNPESEWTIRTLCLVLSRASIIGAGFTLGGREGLSCPAKIAQD
jgi:hypothetical protein